MARLHGQRERGAGQAPKSAESGSAFLLKLRERVHSQEALRPMACWLEQVELAQDGDGDWVLKCPNVFSRQWLSARYGSVLPRLFREELGEDASLRLEVDPSLPSSPSSGVERTDPRDQEPSPPTEGSSRKEEGTAECALPGVDKPFPGWNPRFRFSTFVTGPSNALACSAAQEVAKGPRSEYNPLFIRGTTGLGKTHLGQAIGHAWSQRNPGLRILWSTAEGFFGEMIRHLRNRTILAFKERYREACDLLILDDIQFLTNKTALQAELCHTLDVLLNSGKQVVLLGNLPARGANGLDAHLESRIFSGLAVTLEPPEYETRLAILKQFARSTGVAFPEEIFSALARRIHTHVRELEGAFKRLHATHALSGVPLTQATIDRVLQDGRTGTRRLLDAKAIQAHVARSFGLDAALLASRSRRRTIHYPRQIGMYLSRKHTHESLESIGRLYGRNHASVLYALQSLERKIQTSPRVAREIAYIEEQLFQQG